MGTDNAHNREALAHPDAKLDLPLVSQEYGQVSGHDRSTHPTQLSTLLIPVIFVVLVLLFPVAFFLFLLTQIVPVVVLLLLALHLVPVLFLLAATSLVVFLLLSLEFLPVIVLFPPPTVILPVIVVALLQVPRIDPATRGWK